MNRFDAVIVGGGPAGSSCAWALRRAGRSVLVVDRSRFPRDKPCAGWITPGVVAALGLEVEAYARTHVLQPFHRFRLGLVRDLAPDGKPLDVDYGRPVSFGILRREFDQHLLEWSGAERRLGRPVRSLERSGTRWIVEGEIETPLLVGAGGQFCPVARRLGPGAERDLVVVAQEFELPLPPEEAGLCLTEPDRPELYFCDDLLGYGWSVRKGNWLNVGLGRLDPVALSAHFQAFVGRLEAAGRIPRGLPARVQGHAYRLYRAHRAIVDDGALLVGDAAGLACSASGEGIRPAVESGLMAAEAVLAAAGDYSRQRLQPYASAIARRFGSQSPSPHLPAAVAIPLGRKLLHVPTFARKVVLDRGFLHRGLSPLPPPPVYHLGPFPDA